MASKSIIKGNTLKSINELKDYNFFIPSFQRGYRWRGTKEVRELLEDIWDFANTKITMGGGKAFIVCNP